MRRQRGERVRAEQVLDRVVAQERGEEDRDRRQRRDLVRRSRIDAVGLEAVQACAPSIEPPCWRSAATAARTSVSGEPDFRLRPGDDAVVVAESLGTLAPLKMQHDGAA